MKAFPGTPTFDQDANKTVWQEGMDLRDYFAAKALSSIWHEGNFIFAESDFRLMSNYAYEIADAMMEARNGSQ